MSTTTPATPAAAQDSHFATDHLHADLKMRSIRGGATTVVGQAVRMLLNLGSIMVLGRLLTPRDYGLIGMVTAVTGFAAVFKDLGLSTATIQRSQINHAQVSTLFWINVAISALLAGVVMVLSPLVAWFYGEPQLVPITIALGAAFIVTGVSVQHLALLRRQMRFGATATIDVIALAVGALCGILAAWRGLGHWALVCLAYGQLTTSTVLIWYASGWRPGPPVRHSGIRGILKFGGNLTGFGLVNYLVRNLDNVLIGWYWGPASLGLYTRAYGILLMPLQQINQPMTSVALPTLSRLQDQPQRYRACYTKGILLAAGIGMPIVVATFVLADLVVPLILGKNWTGAVMIYRVLAAAAFVDTFNVAVGWLFVSLGQTGRQFKWQLFESAVTLVLIAAGLPWGPIGVAAGFSASRCLLRFPVIV
jgi:O-antigen/teichoic acid export membrane protein